MPIIKKKVCLVGAAGVGKTSLIKRFVHSVFGEKYLSTIGVDISKKTVCLDDREVMMVIWDTAGEEALYHVPTSYFSGNEGTILVVDGTRPDTLSTGLKIRERAARAGDKSQWICLLNKFDLVASWAVDASTESELAKMNMPTFRTSAKTGTNVDVAFHEMAHKVSNECVTSSMG